MKFVLMFICLVSFTSVSHANLDSIIDFVRGVGSLYGSNFESADAYSQTWTLALTQWPHYVKDTRAKLDSIDGLFMVLSICAGIPSDVKQFMEDTLSTGCDYFRHAETAEFKPVCSFGLRSELMEFLYKMGNFYLQHENEDSFRSHLIDHIRKIFHQYEKSKKTLKQTCDMVLGNESLLNGHQKTSPLVMGCKGLKVVGEVAGGSEARSSASQH